MLNITNKSFNMEGLKNKTLWQRIWDHKLLYLFILPVILWLMLFQYQPMYGATLAFKDYKYNLGIWGSPWVGLKHVNKFISSPEFWTVIKNTLIISGLKLAFCFPAPIILSLLLNEVRSIKLKRTVQTMSYLPNFVSWVVVVQLLTVIFSPYGGIFNNIRNSMGLDSIFVMGAKEAFYPITIFSDIWKNVGWSSIIYLSALSSVSQELYEAAEIDGAGRIRATWHITLPGIKETIGIMFLFAVSGILNAGFEQVFLLQQPANVGISEILDTYVLKTGLNYGRFEYATAIGLFKSVFSITLMFIANTVSKKAMEVSLW